MWHAAGFPHPGSHRPRAESEPGQLRQGLKEGSFGVIEQVLAGYEAMVETREDIENVEKEVPLRYAMKLTHAYQRAHRRPRRTEMIGSLTKTL